MIIFYFLISQMPLDQDPTWGKFLGMATLIKYVGLLCIIYAMFHIATRGTAPRYLATVQARIFLVFFLICTFSYWTRGSTFSIRYSPFISLLSMVFLFFVVLSIVDTFPRLRWTLLTAVGSMGYASLFVLREWMRDPQWRPGSIAGDANYFAMDACLVLPLAFVFVWRSRETWERIFALGCLIATIVSSMLGGSRGGLLALGAAFLWLIWNSPRRIRNFIVVAILVVPPLLWSPHSPLRRLIHPAYGDTIGESDRLIAWKAGLRMIARHPLMGIGLGEFKPQMDAYAATGTGFSSIAHDTYLEVAAETGLPNFLVFIAMLLFTYRSLSQVRRRASNTGPPLLYLAALGLQSGFFGYMVGAFFLSAGYLKLFWLWLFLSMALPSFLPAQAGQRKKTTEFAMATETAPQGMGS
jgi:O-antigen ligase